MDAIKNECDQLGFRKKEFFLCVKQKNFISRIKTTMYIKMKDFFCYLLLRKDKKEKKNVEHLFKYLDFY